ncbi:MAPEG family protein [Flavobacterium sp. MXW15]|uniref:MAPEG family protein n=1 Tax=Xanthomonas chitinilytica TaxID=2989819 RepID=A0ABT3JV20_9XANT|nr:MAPEG family protein [Xanthomonas sp. H13-6]MCW4453362.1 MAPEG family protein [Flavobacterium sp. MXW15]MCW4472285.1 MAPEG family protein [Xanthomonas sp. H13-6]
MDIEIWMLGWAMLLGIAQLLVAASAGSSQRGLKWNASARDGEPKPLTGVAARLQRAWLNYLETFPFFAAAVLAVVATQRQGGQSELAVQLYFWARLVYVPLYAAGIPYLRSLVWGVSVAGIALLLWTLLA